MAAGADGAGLASVQQAYMPAEEVIARGEMALRREARRPAEAFLARLEHKDHLAPQLVAVGGEQLRRADPYSGVGVVAAGVHAVFMHRAEALGRGHMGGRC